jgi:hypothetical protein
MNLREDLRVGLSKAGLGPISAELEKVSRDCIRMRSTAIIDMGKTREALMDIV